MIMAAILCVGVSCNLAYNFTTNAYSDIWHATLFLHVGDSAVVKLWRFDPAEIMEK